MSSYRSFLPMEFKNINKKKSLIKYVQFDKRFFKDTRLPPNKMKILARDMIKKLERIQRSLKGERQSIGNRTRFIRLQSGDSILKQRYRSKRLSMYLNDDIITLAHFSSHNQQMLDIYRSKGRKSGLIFYKYDEFIACLHKYVMDERITDITEYMCANNHFAYDEEQENIIDMRLFSDRTLVSIIGNAGAGKSSVGLEWITDESLKENNNGIYITLSARLALRLKMDFADNIKLIGQEKQRSSMDFISTFKFFKQVLYKLYPNIPEKNYYDPDESWKLFLQFWDEKIGDIRFPCYDDENKFLGADMAKMVVWRYIHGFIKGAIPLNFSLKDIRKIKGELAESEFVALLDEERKGLRGVRNLRWQEKIFSIYKEYKKYLDFNGFIDDNGMACMILKSGDLALDEYKVAFLDECQDLTQLQLLAMFKILGRVEHKRLASDRCQMIQPTYFQEGVMRQYANEYDRFLDKVVPEDNNRPEYLHHNYRSTREIVLFQNSIIDMFKKTKFISLRQEELEPIIAPEIAKSGIKPIWIVNNEKNKTLVKDMLLEGEHNLMMNVIYSSAKEKFESDDGRIIDVVSCKGMEYPVVFMYNILSEMTFDNALAWKYFYVGATRSMAILLLYEECDATSPQLKEFLEESASDGIIIKCDDLSSCREDTESTWQEFINAAIMDVSDEETVIATAYKAIEHGMYKRAISILKKFSGHDETILYCQGKTYEANGEYEKALDEYLLLNDEWQGRGISKKIAIQEMLEEARVTEIPFIAGYMLVHRDDRSPLIGFKNTYMRKYQDESQLYGYMQEAMAKYPFLAEINEKWLKTMILEIDKKIDGFKC